MRGDLGVSSVHRLAARAARQVDVQLAGGSADHVGPRGGQAEANRSVARLSEQNGRVVADLPQRRSATLVADLRTARQQRAATPIQAMQLEPQFLGTGRHLTQSSRTASLTGLEGDVV